MSKGLTRNIDDGQIVFRWASYFDTKDIFAESGSGIIGIVPLTNIHRFRSLIGRVNTTEKKDLIRILQLASRKMSWKAELLGSWPVMSTLNAWSLEILSADAPTRGLIVTVLLLTSSLLQLISVGYLVQRPVPRGNAKPVTLSSTLDLPEDC